MNPPYMGSLWRCIQAHTTQGGWQPDKTPALWHRVEIIVEGTTRVWEKDVAYVVGDVVAFPNEDGAQYACIQAHTSQAGWQPPAAPALWKALEDDGTGVDAPIEVQA